MTPPEATQVDHHDHAGDPPPAVFLCALQTLKKRADFLRANRAARQVRPGFILQARKRHAGESIGKGSETLIRIGYTCSKKVGNAVARNRAKRRLREIARQQLPKLGHAGWDYVLIGRASVTANREFTALSADLTTALAKIHKSSAPGLTATPTPARR